MNGLLSYTLGFLVGSYLTAWSVGRGSFHWWSPLAIAAGAIAGNLIVRGIGRLYDARQARKRGLK